MSKCWRGGLHHPPLLFGSAKLGGQKLVAVMVTDFPFKHHLESACESQIMRKHSPHDAPSLNNAVLKAAVFVPYPVEYKSPNPQAPPVSIIHQDSASCHTDS